MSRLLFSISIIFYLHTSFLHCQTVFNKMYDYNGQMDTPTDLIEDFDGNSIICSRTRPYPTGADSIGIQKTDKYGKEVWYKTYSFCEDCSFEVSGCMVTLKNNEGFAMSGANNKDDPDDDYLYFTLFDNDGNLITLLDIPSTNGFYKVLDFIPTSDGGFAGCGWFSDFVEQDQVSMVFKLDSLGNLEWMWKNNNPEYLIDLATGLLEYNSKIYLTYRLINDFDGELLSKCALKRFSLTGNIDFNVEYGDYSLYTQCSSITQSLEADKLVLGGSSNSKPIVLKIDTLGNLLEFINYDLGYQEEIIYKLHHIPNQGYYGLMRLNIGVPGNYNIKGGLIKLNEDFEYEWHRVYGLVPGNDDEYLEHMIPTSDGGFAMAGYITGLPADVLNNTWLVKVDSLGNDTLPLSNILPEQLFLYPNEDTVITALTYGGSNCYQSYEWSGSGGLPFFMDPVDSMQCHLIAPNDGDYELIYYVEDITGVPLWDTCHISIIPTSISGPALSSQASQILVAPNPAREKFYLTLQDKTIRPQWIKLYTTDGREVMKLDYREEVAIHSLSAGLYFIAVGGNGFSYYAKVVVSN